ncbi:unnamed protein product, partial [Symbiodinium sp. KB8]
MVAAEETATELRQQLRAMEEGMEEKALAAKAAEEAKTQAEAAHAGLQEELQRLQSRCRDMEEDLRTASDSEAQHMAQSSKATAHLREENAELQRNIDELRAQVADLEASDQRWSQQYGEERRAHERGREDLLARSKQLEQRLQSAEASADEASQGRASLQEEVNTWKRRALEAEAQTRRPAARFSQEADHSGVQELQQQLQGLRDEYNSLRQDHVDLLVLVAKQDFDLQALRHTLQAQPNGSALVRSAKQRARAALRAYEEGFDDSLTASYVSDATAVDTATPDSLGGALDDGAMEQSDAYSSLSRSEEASKEGGGRGAARPGPAGSAPRGIDLSTISFEDDKERSAQSYRRSTDNAETAGAANYVHTSSFFSKTQDDGGNSGDG